MAGESVRRYLDVAPYRSIDVEKRHPILGTFKHVGDKFMNGMSLCKLLSSSSCLYAVDPVRYADPIQDERRDFVRTIKEFLDACDEEQRLKLNSEIPSLKVYWDLRMGTSASRCLTAILQ